MKKNSLFAFAFIITLFVSCDKEENSENDLTEISAKIVGDWNLVGYDVVDGLISTSIEGMDFSFPTTITGKEYDASLSFSKTPNKYTSSGSFVVLVEFEIQGQSYSQEETIEDFIADGEWALEEGGLLIVITEGEEAAYTIKTLTDTSFVLEYNLKLNQEIDGVAFTTTGTYTMTLEKNK